MDLNHYNGEPVADPGKFIRLTLRGHYVRWRLDRELAASPSAEPASPVPEAHSSAGLSSRVSSSSSAAQAAARSDQKSAQPAVGSR